MGFSAITASDGREALEVYRQLAAKIDLIMLDLIMPELGGIATYHEVRRISAEIPLIICSGYGVEEVLGIIENDSCAGFIQKPYRPDELRKILSTFIEKGRAASASALRDKTILR
jgi:CheY-like chemotaxis protein